MQISSLQAVFGVIIMVASIITTIAAVITNFVNHKRDIRELKETKEEQQEEIDGLKLDVVSINKQLEEGKGKFKRLDEVVIERDKQITCITGNCQKHGDKIANIELDHVRMNESNRNTDEKLNQIFKMLDKMNETIQNMAVSFAEYKKNAK